MSGHPGRALFSAVMAMKKSELIKLRFTEGCQSAGETWILRTLNFLIITVTDSCAQTP